MVEIKVTGMAELKQTLMALPEAIRLRVVKGMVATGAEIFRAEAVSRAPVFTGPISAGHPPSGTLKRAIYKTRMPSECTDTREVWKVSVKKGKAAQTSGSNSSSSGPEQVNQDAFYARWVEYGHYTRAPKGLAPTQFGRRQIVSTGSQMVIGAHYVSPKPFMRPSFETKKQAAVNAMGTYLAYKLADAVLFAKPTSK